MSSATHVLDELSKRNPEEIEAWTWGLLEFGRATPDCPWPGESLSYLRLCRLLDFRAAPEEDPYLAVKTRLVSAAESVAAAALPDRTLPYLWIQLLYLGASLRNEAILKRLCEKLLDPSGAEPTFAGRSIARDLLRPSIVRLLEWDFLKPYVRHLAETTDAIGVASAALRAWALRATEGEMDVLLGLIEDAVLRLGDESVASEGLLALREDRPVVHLQRFHAILSARWGELLPALRERWMSVLLDAGITPHPGITVAKAPLEARVDLAVSLCYSR